MRRATFLASARDDLLAILTYVADASGSIAIGENFLRQLRVQCNRLAAIEGMVGRPRPELRPDIRSFPCKNYVIFLRYVSGRFEVVNILDRHLDVETRFSASEDP